MTYWLLMLAATAVPLLIGVYARWQQDQDEAQRARAKQALLEGQQELLARQAAQTGIPLTLPADMPIERQARLMAIYEIEAHDAMLRGELPHPPEPEPEREPDELDAWLRESLTRPVLRTLNGKVVYPVSMKRETR